MGIAAPTAQTSTADENLEVEPGRSIEYLTAIRRNLDKTEADLNRLSDASIGLSDRLVIVQEMAIQLTTGPLNMGVAPELKEERNFFTRPEASDNPLWPLWQKLVVRGRQLEHDWLQAMMKHLEKGSFYQRWAEGSYEAKYAAPVREKGEATICQESYDRVEAALRTVEGLPPGDPNRAVLIQEFGTLLSGSRAMYACIDPTTRKVMRQLSSDQNYKATPPSEDLKKRTRRLEGSWLLLIQAEHPEETVRAWAQKKITALLPDIFTTA